MASKAKNILSKLTDKRSRVMRLLAQIENNRNKSLVAELREELQLVAGQAVSGG